MNKQYTVEQAHRMQDLAESLLDKRLTLKAVKEIAAVEFPELKIHTGRCSKGLAHDLLIGNAQATYERIEKEAVTSEKVETVTEAVTSEKVETVTEAVTSEKVETVTEAVTPEKVETVTEAVTPEKVETVTEAVTPEKVETVTTTSKQALIDAGTDAHLQENLSIPVVKYVIYHRVSTQKQGRSGLGLEAQQRDIDVYLNTYSDKPYSIVETFTDVRSAKGHKLTDRPVLAEAVELAERTGAVLLVSKLDRLGRSVELVSHLLNRKNLSVRVACMPEADCMQLQIYAVLAEQERKFISVRTKAALAVAKDRGRKLGGFREGAGRKQKAEALEAAKPLETIISECLDSVVPEHRSLGYIADKLNKAGHKTARGKEFSKMQVSRVIKYLGLREEG